MLNITRCLLQITAKRLENMHPNKAGSIPKLKGELTINSRLTVIGMFYQIKLFYFLSLLKSSNLACRTVSGPNTGALCVFPFIYKVRVVYFKIVQYE
jgi:hypothetical protein